jgi:hypothetical protein
MKINVSPESLKKPEDRVVPNKDRIRKVIESKKIPVEFGIDDVVQDFMGTNQISAAPIVNFDGVDNRNGVLPPDTQGDVGPNHYIQMVNLSFQIWDKNGNSLFGPPNNSVLWDGFGDPWDGSNDGDPIVLYDELADRWLFSQFALPNYPNGPFFILIAVTETGDPTGSWYRYGYSFNDMPDYPKFAVWSDGYYMTVNQFARQLKLGRCRCCGDALSSRLLFRLQYRNFGSYQTLVTNHTINVASSGNHAGVRWYELRNTGSGWSIFQQGTFAPDNENRWMGSAAMDGYGNIALGYSVSSSTVYPSIRYTGRMAGDPAGQMTIPEHTIINGAGSQTHTK